MRVYYLFVALSLAACTSTYHPEYHPVTSTNITQTYSGTGAAPRAIPAPTGGGVIVEHPQAADPDEFFQTSYR